MELKKSDYESYDYRQFWEDDKRAYEDASERLAISKLFKGENKKGTIIDIGCGYGRLFNEYCDYDTIIMLDYSLNNLKNAQISIKNYLKQDNKKFSKVYFIAADAANLPFKNEIADTAISVRIVHHLNDPEKLISETGRILMENGLFILEFANKRNLKNIFKFFFGKLKTSPFSRQPLRIGDTILNQHPNIIINYLKKYNFRIKKVISVSNLRTQFLKRKFKFGNLLMLENISQELFSFCKSGPSIFIKSFLQRTNQKKVLNNLAEKPDSFKDMLLCPECRDKKSKFKISDNLIVCNLCGAKFLIIDGIYDLRTSQ